MIALISGFYNSISERLPMDELRRNAAEIGLRQPVTYQSTGNLVFDADDQPSSVEEELTFAIWTSGFDIRTFVRTGDELARIVAANPFRDKEITASRLRVFFLERTPDPPERDLLMDTDWHGNDIHLRGRELFVYLHAPESHVFSHLKRFERTTGIAATARNWNTVMRLHHLCQER
jgi:uncharacterized protein (DUF1697 family)